MSCNGACMAQQQFTGPASWHRTAGTLALPARTTAVMPMILFGGCRSCPLTLQGCHRAQLLQVMSWCC